MPVSIEALRAWRFVQFVRLKQGETELPRELTMDMKRCTRPNVATVRL